MWSVLTRALGALVLAAGLAACATTGPAGDDDRLAAWAAHRAWLEGVSTWRASGRVAVSSGSESFSATLRWRQARDGFRIQLSGPFGQGAVRVEGAGGGVVLRTADGRIARAPTPEALLAAELGVQVPVSVLRYWLLGRPAPGSTPQVLDLDWAGRIARLEQAGWQVNYQEYRDSGAGALPARLDIRNEQVEARILISRWQVGA